MCTNKKGLNQRVNAVLDHKKASEWSCTRGSASRNAAGTPANPCETSRPTAVPINTNAGSSGANTVYAGASTVMFNGSNTPATYEK